MINKYGAVHFEKLEGIISRLPTFGKFGNKLEKEMFGITGGMPPFALFVESRLQIQSLGSPDLLSAIAWNLTKKDNKEYFHISGFKIGTEEWENNLMESIRNLEMYSYAQGFKTQFEIDEEIKRFRHSNKKPGDIFKD